MPTDETEGVVSGTDRSVRKQDVHGQVQLRFIQVRGHRVFRARVAEVDEVQVCEGVEEREDECAAAAEPTRAVVQYDDGMWLTLVQRALQPCTIAVIEQAQVRPEKREGERADVHDDRDGAVEDDAAEEHPTFGGVPTDDGKTFPE